jgi:glutathione S-transferase
MTTQSKEQRFSKMKLVIGNKNYSSWSLRPWILLRHFTIPFDEQNINLFADNMREQMEPFCPNFKVPALMDYDINVWDSLAICEYINDSYLDNAGWPKDLQERAQARAISAEMHAGFIHLRSELPMNCRRTPSPITLSEGAKDDIKRINEILQKYLSAVTTHNEDDDTFLFGAFSVADAMYLPVLSRFQSYQIEVPPIVQQYMKLMLKLPSYKQWLRSAVAEVEVISDSEI